MKSNLFHRIVSYQYSGLMVFLSFLIWVLVSEYVPTFIKNDFGGFIWTTFHFVLNPILGLSIAIFICWHALKQRFWVKVVSLLSTCFPLFISYVGFSGNIWFIQLLGIDFK